MLVIRFVSNLMFTRTGLLTKLYAGTEEILLWENTTIVTSDGIVGTVVNPLLLASNVMADNLEIVTAKHSKNKTVDHMMKYFYPLVF